MLMEKKHKLNEVMFAWATAWKGPIPPCNPSPGDIWIEDEKEVGEVILIEKINQSNLGE